MNKTLACLAAISFALAASACSTTQLASASAPPFNLGPQLVANANGLPCPSLHARLRPGSPAMSEAPLCYWSRGGQSRTTPTSRAAGRQSRHRGRPHALTRLRPPVQPACELLRWPILTAAATRPGARRRALAESGLRRTTRTLLDFSRCSSPSTGRLGRHTADQ